MTARPFPSHGLESPACGGRVPTAVGGGPTPPPPHPHISATGLKSPQHWGAGHPPQRVGGRHSALSTQHSALAPGRKEGSKSGQTNLLIVNPQPACTIGYGCVARSVAAISDTIVPYCAGVGCW
jgi:hypothetical protein